MKEYHKIITVYKRNPDTNFKTLIEGVFALPELEYLSNCKWVFTEKVDGTNIRVKYESGLLSYGGKTDNAQMPSFLYNKLNTIFNPDIMKNIFPDYDACLYGEGYGAKIQKGGGNYVKDGVDFVLFDVLVGGFWLKRQDVEEIADKLQIKVVPIIGFGTLEEAIELTRDGFKSVWGDFIAEGLVMRPRIELKNREGYRIITKIKHKDFKRC